MKAFYDGISSGVPFAKAMQAAQRRLLSDPRRAHPYFWAPFILVGAGGG
jgi:CHAT domain-containing protein